VSKVCKKNNSNLDQTYSKFVLKVEELLRITQKDPKPSIPPKNPKQTTVTKCDLVQFASVLPKYGGSARHALTGT
jgi:hypothetical protein